MKGLGAVTELGSGGLGVQIQVNITRAEVLARPSDSSPLTDEETAPLPSETHSSAPLKSL